MESPEEMDINYAEILTKVQGRLAELGIDHKFLNVGIIRIINEVSVDYWASVDEEAKEGDPIDFRIVMGEVDARQRCIIEAVATDGRKIPVGKVSLKDDAFYIPGHRIKVDTDGELISQHPDRSRCKLICVTCDDPMPYVYETDGEFYVRCNSCKTMTDTYANKFLAIAAWLCGKAEEQVD